MKPCKICKYAALCLTHGGANATANWLMWEAPKEMVQVTGYLKYADGTDAPVSINKSGAVFLRTRPKDCPGVFREQETMQEV